MAPRAPRDPMAHDLRIIPSIEQLRQRGAVQRLESVYGRDATVDALREEAAALRQLLAAARVEMRDAADAVDHIERRVEARLHEGLAPSLKPVINATGVIVHTNLGRAPLAATAVQRVAEVARSYANLEYDLASGSRGSRSIHAAALLTRLTGAEAALVVNNNAAAVLLVLAALAAGREVIISRGELVEIGGGFRIPDVLRQSGATLREVGTTNRTRAADYASAIGERTAVILRVHPSNFKVEGFTETPALTEVVEIASRFEVPVIEDLGSGNLLTSPEIGSEPTVRRSIDAGVSVCTFSGDKLLGGPQAGLIVGRRATLDTLRAHPLMRALRVDKLTYAALEATLVEHATDRAPVTVPVARMISTPVDRLEERARALVERLTQHAALQVSVEPSAATIGGGSAPGLTLPSRALVVARADLSAAALESELRRATPPVVGRIEDDRVLLDLRTVAPEQDDAMVDVLSRVAGPR